MPKQKIVRIDLNSPHRALSNGGLGIVAALLVPWQNDFLSVSTRGVFLLGAQSSCTYVDINLRCRSWHQKGSIFI